MFFPPTTPIHSRSNTTEWYRRCEPCGDELENWAQPEKYWQKVSSVMANGKFKICSKKTPVQP